MLQKIESDSHGAHSESEGVGSAPFACERSLFRNYKIVDKKMLRRKLLKAIHTALTQSLKDRDWRPLARERILFRSYKIAGKKTSASKFLKAIPKALT